jgi:predicted ATPase
MQYAELIHFENLEPVIQLRHADLSAKVKRLITTYVISEEMAAKLIHSVFEQLRFDHKTDKKGLFIIGNYGTGKSHLMAVISSIAENADLLEYLNHQQVAKAAQPNIAGKFHVIRVEMSAVERSLRDCLTAEIEAYLNSINVNFQFPPANQITNNKGAFEKMMAAFEAHCPGQGLLIVVDELLEFLSSRKDRELILDLSFLREIGEVCQDLRFRFIAGLQETVFDNPRFKFAANELRRVKDRFEQVLITRKDIKFVVAERLLKKNAQQKKKIRAYLQPFAKFYGTMNERLDEFVELFPVHPDYIDIFERIIAVEQREILKTLERAMQTLLDQQVPATYPKLLAYDSYWNTLRENFSFRATDDIREVINCSQVLEDRITSAFTRPNYKAMALRIIHALSVHRLTTPDFYTPVGVTARELLENLCLYQPGIEDLGNPADDLLSQVELVLHEILKTVNRQFISANPHNGQYYLDLKKTEDFDAIIENRAEIVEDNELDRYYYVALRQVMELTDEPYVGNFLIWQHELEWLSHKVTRQGYLFFGTPNERATAVPSRDFYLYLLQPYDPPKYKKNATTADEVFFRLKEKDEDFVQSLRNYTAASILVLNSSGHPKSVYDSKAKFYLNQLVAWLQAHLTDAFEVTYQNRTKPLLDWTKGKNVREMAGLGTDARFNFRELIELVASICLESYFYEMAPEYPVFTTLITSENLSQAAQDALRGIASKKRSKQANSILDALQLLEGEDFKPLNAQYATDILNLLHKKPQGQVLNRSELLPEYYFAPEKYRLEPEFVIVLVAALVYAGEVVLALPGQKLDASDFARLAETPIKDLLAFKHIEAPKDFNVPALKALFELLSLPSKLAINLTQNDEGAVHQLRTQVNNRLESLVKAQDELVNGIIFWGKAVLTEAELENYRGRLSESKHFLETLHTYATPAHFKNFRYTAEEVTAQLGGFEALEEISQLQSILQDLNTATAYLMTAEVVLPPDHDWVIEMKKVRDNLLPRLTDKTQRASSGFSYHTQQELGALQKDYRQIYLDLHQQAKLGATESEEKKQLLQDARLAQLKKLAQIDLMPRQQLEDWEARLNQLASCFDLNEYDLFVHAFCPHCEFKPTSQMQEPAVDKLAELSESLEQLHGAWTQILLTELKGVADSEQWGLLQAKNRSLLDKFLSEKMLPEEISLEFLEAVREALTGLEKVSFNFNDLQRAIVRGGFPVTLLELQVRIERYLRKITKDKDGHNVRIVLE